MKSLAEKGDGRESRRSLGASETAMTAQATQRYLGIPLGYALGMHKAKVRDTLSDALVVTSMFFFKTKFNE